MRMADHNIYCKRLIGIIRGPSGNISKWEYKVTNMIKKITEDGAEHDFIDVDMVLYEMVREFRNQKGAFQRSLEKEFMERLDTYSADVECSFDNFVKVVESIQMGD